MSTGPSIHARPSFVTSTAVTAAVAFFWCWIRLVWLSNIAVTLTFVLPLLLCVWTGRRWQLWLMTVVFLITAVIKSVWLLPANAFPNGGERLYLGFTLFNILAGSIVVHAILRLRERLESQNSIITAQNAKLEAQAEELAQQNEEIRAQNEELAEQNEEIESQTEEVARQNEELVDSNHRLASREEILQGLLESSRSPDLASRTLGNLCRRTLQVMGDPASAVAVLQLEGDRLTLQAHFSTTEGLTLPAIWPVERSLAGLVLAEHKTAYVSDLGKRPDLAEPFAGSTHIRSLLATPVRMSGAPSGVLIVCSPEESHWTDEQFRTVEWVAAQCGPVMEAERWQKILTERALEVEQASRAKDNFLATLSHELRTPLTPILMTAAALREDERLPEDARAQLGMIERNIALEARLIDDLLDLTRIAKGKLPLRPQPCDAHSLIGLAMEIVRDDAQEKGLVLERDFGAKLSGLMADPSRFQQVIWNLLRNAVKFTPKGGRISIRTRDDGHHGDSPRLRIEVCDTGIGISPGQIEHIFQPFEQGEVTGDHKFGGLGLGLAIARAIVDLHHGTIEAASAGPNQGATFVVELPGAFPPPPGIVPSSAGSGADAASQDTPDKHLPPLRILLVEDHDATLQVLSRLLGRQGHRVTAVSSITSAQSEAQAQTFDLVISDLGLPDGSGNELMEKLREKYNFPGIALSGYGMEQDLERSRNAGFVAHLIKPVDLNQLQRAIATALGSGEQ